MNIVVCVKYVPDAQVDRGFEADNTTDRESVDGLLSELDEYAVEAALQLVEAGEGEVTVLTMGPDDAVAAVKKSLQWVRTRVCTCVTRRSVARTRWRRPWCWPRRPQDRR